MEWWQAAAADPAPLAPPSRRTQQQGSAAKPNPPDFTSPLARHTTAYGKQASQKLAVSGATASGLSCPHCLGGDDAGPFGDIFWFLSSGVDALAWRISLTGGIAYLEAEIFGGTGTQAIVLWRNGQVCLGPVATEFTATAPDSSSSPQWPFNQALRELGVDRHARNGDF